MNEQFPLHGIAVYNPGILSTDELKRYFVARQGLLDQLLDGLRREAAGQAPQHRLIVGTRGMGKTTLLHRFALAVLEDEGLAQYWLPLKFPEEQYNITRLSDLWANCLDALGDTLESLGEHDLLEELDSRVDALPADEEPRSRQAFEALMAFADRLGRRLLLLIDNLDIVLERLHDAHWAIREVLGHEPRLMLVGASARVLESTYEYQAAFYDFFKIHELKGLSESEMSAVLCRLAEVEGNPAIARMIEREPGRLRTLHTLTGGNPRTAVLLYGVLAQGMEGDVRSDLERLLDQCTPLYKARFEELPAQAQKVVDAMAVHWDPLTAARLAELTRLPVNSVSTQLTRLEQQAVVEKVPLRPGKKNGFQIAERFFNIWYLMRTSRRVRRRLIWLVRFLKVFYSQDQLRERARRHLLDGQSQPGEAGLRHAELGFSYASAVEDQTLRAALEGSALRTLVADRKLSRELAAIIDFEGDDGDLRDRAERMRFLRELPEQVRRARGDWPPGVSPTDFAAALVGSLSLTPEQKRQVAESLPRMEEAQVLALQDDLNKEHTSWRDQLFGNEELINRLSLAVTEGFAANALDLPGMRIAAEALQSGLLGAYADTLMLEATDPHLSADEHQRIHQGIETFGLHYAWIDLGVALKASGDLDGAIAAYRQQLAVKPDHQSAWYNLGNALSENGDLDGAIDAYRQQLAIEPDHEWAWSNLGIALSENGDLDGAIAAFRQQLAVKPDHEGAWNNLGIALKANGDLDGAMAAYRQGMRHESTRGRCHNGLAWLFYEQRRELAEAEGLAREAAERNPENRDVLHTFATVLAANGHWPEARVQAARFLALSDDEWLETTWNELLMFFREAVGHGHAADAARLLEETQWNERLRPLHTALLAIAEGADQFTRVAPEVRQPAEAIMAQLTDDVERAE
ncbi:MAG: tetratricopeptide repeat protein [Gammaproteobacteria bacterium]